LDESFAVQRFLTDRNPRKAFLVGAGYIGLEVADALTQRGLEVTLLCRPDTVLPTVDPALGRLVQEELERHGVRVLTAGSAVEISEMATGCRSRLSIRDSGGIKHEAHLVLLAVGARPDSELADMLGAGGAIVVTRQMRTNLAGALAAGDCVETTTACLMRRPISADSGCRGIRETIRTFRSLVAAVCKLLLAKKLANGARTWRSHTKVEAVILTRLT
jgi:pyruvate/2-oxoglutarate dehydrogenase complex dihydrolipoamide dehydrogenase (E3) component